MLSIQVEGLEAVARQLRNLPKQLAYATSQAVNETAFVARTDLQTEMQRVFDRPTPWIRRSIWVSTASPSRLELQIYPRDMGGKSVDPSDVLMSEVFGGARKYKRAERALQRIG